MSSPTAHQEEDSVKLLMKEDLVEEETAFANEETPSIAVEGSDMTRDIHVALFKDRNRPASKSMPEEEFVMYQDIGKASDIAKPGGFRRDHVIVQKEIEGEKIPPHAYRPFLDVVKRNAFKDATKAVGQTYDDFIFANFEVGLSMEDFEDDEMRTPLIRRAFRRSRHKAGLDQIDEDVEKDEPEERGASVKKTVFTILKSFIGSGILFLPKGFENGGMLFSITLLVCSAILSTFCMLRLTQCATAVKSKSGISYGLLGEIALGRTGRVAVNVSLILSQLGFCCSYLIFVEKNLRDIISLLSHNSIDPSPWLLLVLQIPIYTPLTWVRKIKYFAMTNLLADVLILFGLVYIMCYSVEVMAVAKAPSEWYNFNADNWALFLGTAVYVFEGIGLVLPIYDAMDKSVKSKFPVILSNTICCLVVFFCLFSGLVYAAFGKNTKSVVTLNLPSGVNAGRISVQVAYCVALMFTYPLMLYPAIMIIEGYLLPSNRMQSKGELKWKKNAFRFCLVLITALISYAGMDQLDNFVAIIGGFCSVPLAFIYPCVFHSCIIGDSHVANLAIVVIGLCVMVFATTQAIRTWN